MIASKLITKENAIKRLKDRNLDFMAIFVSGSNLHPNPRMYKYYWWIYSMESQEKSAAEVFYTKAYRLTIKEFERESTRLTENKISYAYINRKIHRLDSIFNYEKLKEKYPDMEFAPSYEDDSDEMNEEGHK
ncbi:hypothetical protein CRU94_05465 [Arcobacter sp. AHV-9/2010]|uniref:hypothetical protein n=1 Tax=Arcobacter sp. AHV-9/2010 TaxID=2021861 RepID=UPI00100ACDA0|nr:hypothetical protein [Arcobacter sp. CECT 9299]RXJ96059.1 hypothetical protein CRU94_05465 [Arcobacter sp. CECT 9299]